MQEFMIPIVVNRNCHFEKSSRLSYSITSGFAEVNHRQFQQKYQYQVSLKRLSNAYLYLKFIVVMKYQN